MFPCCHLPLRCNDFPFFSTSQPCQVVWPVEPHFKSCSNLRDENLVVILKAMLVSFNTVLSFSRFPEMQFFQQENVRKILTDVLFCYARENEQLLYKQVMKISYRWHLLTQNFLYSLTNDRAIMQPLLYPKLY